KNIKDNSEHEISLPAGARISPPQWSPDGRRFAFTNTLPNGIELWIGDAATAEVRKVEGARINAAFGDAMQWMPGGKTLIVKLVPANRTMPNASTTPTGPNVQESSGRTAPIRTYQDLLKTPYDESLFDYYATSQLAFVDAESMKVLSFAAPALYSSIEPAPDGEHLLVARVKRPYSFLLPSFAFPREVTVTNRTGKQIYKLADLPLADAVPIDGVPIGQRGYNWRPDQPATLLWVEALDEGDPKKKVSHRDRILTLRAPFTNQPTELMRTEHRFSGMQFAEKGGFMFVRDFERDRRWVRTFLVNADKPTDAPRVVWSMDAQDRYNDPGAPITHVLSNGHRAILQNGNYIYLSGAGASSEGDRPFLDRFNLETLKPERLFRSDATSYESFVALLDNEATRIITRRESPLAPPNYYIRTISKTETANSNDSSLRTLTNFPDPSPQLRDIKKQIVQYKRADGVDLSFTLYLPPGYKEGTRLPTVVWAYPLEFTDPTTAGQVTGSTQRFTAIGSASHLFFLLQGYAVLDNATMPVVGKPETVNDTYVDQIVMSARAAIDKAVEMGVADRERVGVGGHSYGAFMTANLLAHSDLFRAGIARSGAYNRTLTPFGFQSERRTLWEAPELYAKVSPFTYANKINEPILFIHGEADDNTGTFPVQSERMYQAVRGTGGTVRLVMLPAEAHGYAARESIEHTLYEMLSWFDRHVKNAKPRRAPEQRAER
ncbi:MAG: S9 family peptidase, partial [Pyrinomonadaceae bacterium]|nr:S9 family peptidase [Pyrinomonadaceae bacterium]